jgi:hypothetical protein
MESDGKKNNQRKSRQMSKQTKSELKYYYNTSLEEVKDGVMSMIEETVIDGKKGLSIKFFKKSDDKLDKVSAKQKEDGTYVMSVIKAGKKEEKDNLSKSSLITELKKHKEMKFAVDYLSKMKGGRQSRKSK